MADKTRWQDRQTPSKHNGKRCRVPVYHYGGEEVHVALWNYGTIRAAVLGKKSDEVIGYAVEYDLASIYAHDIPYSYASARDIQILS